MTGTDRKILVMGIVNATDDSFFAPSRFNMGVLESGADIIDIGAVSTRPGAAPVSEEEEWRRLKKVLAEVDPALSISIDTFRSGIVVKACDFLGRKIIVNDISAGEDDPLMLETAAGLGLQYIAMHKRGTPQTMQDLCGYDDVTAEVLEYFRRFSLRAQEAGLEDWILDPGFGFAKTAQQNFQMLSELGRFNETGRKILVGISRKSFIFKTLDISPEEALPATTALHLIALENGADILRVHDVEQARQAVALYRSLNHSSMI